VSYRPAPQRASRFASVGRESPRRATTSPRIAIESRDRLRRDPRVKYTARLILVTATYFAAAKAGLEFAFGNESVTSIWPPSGVALAVVLIWGYRMWPAVAAGAFLANITTAGSVLTVLGIATGNTLEALAGAYLLRRVGFRLSLDRVRDVVALAGLAAFLSTMISATVGVSSLWASGLVANGDLATTWRVWWLGDMGGDLLVAPLLLVLASGPILEARPWIRIEAATLVVALVGVSMVTFASGQPVAYLLFPVLFWVALRFRQVGTVVTGLIAAAIAIWFTARGQGQFVGGSEDAELLRSQMFVGVATITGLLVAALVTERRRDAERLRQLADHDTLTGLLNRRRFLEELEKWIAYHSRYGGRGAVLMVDVDYFKRVNDALGHVAGDDLIRRLGQLLHERLRETDVIARIGGDEFVILLPNTSEEESLSVATALLQKTREEAAAEGGGQRIPVTISVGICPFGHGLDVDARKALTGADVAMYGAKEAGRDRLHIVRGNGAPDRSIAAPGESGQHPVRERA
jgi:diguanylate cyclase (GGDEF)-like protein